MRKNRKILLTLSLLLFSVGMIGTIVSTAGTVSNTSAVGRRPSVSGSIIAFTTYEYDAEEDLNGDGSKNDLLIRYYNISDKSLVNTGVRGGIRGRIRGTRGKIVPRTRRISRMVGEGPSVSGPIIAFTTNSVIHYYNISDKSLVNTKAIGRFPSISGSIIAFATHEKSSGKDLNSDGDRDDYVIRYYDISKKSLVNTGAVGRHPSVSGSIIVFTTNERFVGKDLNSDGDRDDYVIRYYDISKRSLVNTGVEGGLQDEGPSVSGSVIAFTTNERWVGKDLNGDGDRDDYVIRYYNISDKSLVNTKAVGNFPSISNSIIAFTTSNCIIGYYDISKRSFVNTGVEGGLQDEGPSVSGSVIAFTTFEPWVKGWPSWWGKDLNGDGDKNDYVIRYYHIEK